MMIMMPSYIMDLLSSHAIAAFPTLLGCASVIAVLLVLYALAAPPIPRVIINKEPSGIKKPLRSSRSNSTTMQGHIPCYNPGTQELLGFVHAMTPAEVQGAVKRAKSAAEEWKFSSFAHRRRLLRILLKYILDNQEEICRISAIDSGKPMVDAAFGELIVTCEKIHWLLSQGEKWLRPESRSPGKMMFYKKARVEFHPVGVVGAIVPFNYPFHNIFNPLTAAIFAGNAIVIKVSEHASWSAMHYASAIESALDLAGAPPGLVQIVTGYAEAGQALVTSPDLNKLIFVGSTAVGRRVMNAASENVTPVVLELGGKDPFIVCDDADLKAAVPTALRGCFQSCGQNCTGAERFIVHENVVDDFVQRAVQAVQEMRHGPGYDKGYPPTRVVVDCGSLCLPGLAEKVARLVDDAVSKGAVLVAGGKAGGEGEGAAKDYFYLPTILTNVNSTMQIWHEEVFGPVMAITTFSTDEEAIQLANDCAFGLGSSVYSRNIHRARRIASQLQVGMTSINDFAATYMAQSLPFGGVKQSGFDRFGGVEGLRGLCIPKAVAEDRWPFSTTIPPMLQYPVKPQAFEFVSSLVWMFYGQSWGQSLRGLQGLIKTSLFPSQKSSKSD